MNEQIKELLNQAGIYQLDRFDAIDGSNQMEKFAQLIVQKCADIGQQYADGNYEVYNQILEHFGVEE
jgi:ABC-type transport system substrate-binding protein